MQSTGYIPVRVPCEMSHKTDHLKRGKLFKEFQFMHIVPTPKNQMKMYRYKRNLLATLLKDDMDSSWEDALFHSEDEESVVTRKTSISGNISTKEFPCISDMEISEVADVQHYFANMKVECSQLVKSVIWQG